MGKINTVAYINKIKAHKGFNDRHEKDIMYAFSTTSDLGTSGTGDVDDGKSMADETEFWAKWVDHMIAINLTPDDISFVDFGGDAK